MIPPDPELLVRQAIARQRKMLKARQRSYRSTRHAPGATKALPVPTPKVKRKMSKTSRRKNR